MYGPMKGKRIFQGLAALFFLISGGAGNVTSPHRAENVLNADLAPVPGEVSASGEPTFDDTCPCFGASGYPFPSFPYPSEPAPSLLPEADPLVLPLKQAGRLFLIEAVIDGVNGNLVFDTGARELLLNKTYFRNHLSVDMVNSMGITGDVARVDLITARRVEFCGMVFERLTAGVTDLSHIEDRRGVKILGVVGYSLLKKFEVLFDPVNGQLTLFRTDASGRRSNGIYPLFKADHLQKMPGSGSVVFMKGSIAGKSLNFCFDTAAETNVISSSSHKLVLATISVTRRTSLKGAGSRVSEVLYGTMNDFLLGDRKIENMDTVVTSLLSLREAYNTSLDGILGYSFFHNGEVCVNYKTREIGIRFVKGGEE